MDINAPRLTLDTAIPDRLPVVINVGSERRVYWLRDTAEYGTRERKRLSSLLQGIVDFEQADEETINDDDVRVYEAAMRQVMTITMPDVPGDVVESLSLREHGRLCAFVLKLFTEGAQETQTAPALPPPTPLPAAPTRLRKLAGRLTSASR